MRESPPGRVSPIQLYTQTAHTFHTRELERGRWHCRRQERAQRGLSRMLSSSCSNLRAMSPSTACSAVCKKLLLLRSNLFMKKQRALLGNLCASITVGSACGAASSGARARAQRSRGQNRILYSKVALKVLSKAGTKLEWAWWRVQGWCRGAHGCAQRWCAVSGRARKRDPPSHC